MCKVKQDVVNVLKLKIHLGLLFSSLSVTTFKTEKRDNQNDVPFCWLSNLWQKSQLPSIILKYSRSICKSFYISTEIFRYLFYVEKNVEAVTNTAGGYNRLSFCCEISVSCQSCHSISCSKYIFNQLFKVSQSLFLYEFIKRGILFIVRCKKKIAY